MANQEETAEVRVYWIYQCIFVSAMTIVTGICFTLLYGVSWPFFVRFVFGTCAFVTVCVFWTTAKKFINKGPRTSD